MLDKMRVGAKSIVAKGFFFILMLSFAAWGIGDMLRSDTTQVVARLGDVIISAPQLREAASAEAQNIARATRRQLSAEDTRLLQRTVLMRMLREATLNDEATRLGLVVTDQEIARLVQETESFKGPDGQFNALAFRDALRNAGLTEATFLRGEREGQKRQMLSTAVQVTSTPPVTLLEPLWLYGQEKRTLSVLEVTDKAVGPLPAPSADDVASYFETNKAQFRLPESRDVHVLDLRPKTLLDRMAVASEEVKAEYERRLPTEFQKPERRHLWQLTLKNEAEVTKAQELLGQGRSFEALMTALGAKETDVDLGSLTKADMLDPALADRVFALQQGAMSPLVDTAFGKVVVLVKGITPAVQTPFDQVAATLQNDVKLRKAKDAVFALHDRIEDQRAAGQRLEEIAQKESLPLVDLKGLERTAAARPTPYTEAIRLAFQTEVDIETSALNLDDGGYQWIEVKAIRPARDRTLDEAQADVQARLQQQALRKAKEAKAREWQVLVEKQGWTMAQKSIGVSAQSLKEIQRGQPVTPLSAKALSQLFALPLQGRAIVAHQDGSETILAMVTSITAPDPAAQTEKDALARQLQQALNEDLLQATIADLQARRGLFIDEAVLSRLSQQP